MNKQTRLRQIKNLSLPQLIVAPRISRVICVIPSPSPILHQLYNLSKINNESKCFTVHFRLDLRSSQFRTSSYHKKYTPSTFFLERKNYIRTFTTINTFLLLFFRKNFLENVPKQEKRTQFPLFFFFAPSPKKLENMKSKNRVVKRYECYQPPPLPLVSKRYIVNGVSGGFRSAERGQKGKEKNIGARGTKKYIYRVTSR